MNSRPYLKGHILEEDRQGVWDRSTGMDLGVVMMFEELGTFRRDPPPQKMRQTTKQTK